MKSNKIAYYLPFYSQKVKVTLRIRVGFDETILGARCWKVLMYEEIQHLFIASFAMAKGRSLEGLEKCGFYNRSPCTLSLIQTNVYRPVEFI